MVSPVAGFTVGNVFPEAASTHLPPMKSFRGLTCSCAAVAMASPSNLGVYEILRILYCRASLSLFPFELRLPLVHIGCQTFLDVLAGEEQLLQFALDAQHIGKGNFRSGDHGAHD